MGGVSPTQSRLRGFFSGMVGLAAVAAAVAAAAFAVAARYYSRLEDVSVMFLLLAAVSGAVGLFAAWWAWCFPSAPPARYVDDAGVRGAISAAGSLVGFLKSLDRSLKCANILAGISGMDAVAPRASLFDINDRLAAIAYTDIRNVFCRLGNPRTLLSNPEGIGYCAVVMQLFNIGAAPEMLLDPRTRDKVVEIIEKFEKTCNLSLSVEGADGGFAFAAVFGGKAGECQWVRRYATAMYRWASFVAKVDGTVTRKESETLASIMSMAAGPGSDGEEGMAADGIQDDAPRTSGMEAIMERLDGLVGLESVKAEVRALASFIDIQAKRRQSRMKAASVSCHCVFTGNPGTGKTTVARLLADIFRETGIVKKGHLVETDRSGLVGEYVGQTAVKTNKTIDRAIDGVLFIDEAYSLVQGGDRDYGAEAVSTLLKRMEDDRGRLVVILAGYPGAMESFLDSNPGLRSRFGRRIEFPDYNAAELARIFGMYAEKSEYTCGPGVREAVAGAMAAAIAEQGRNFGNARFARNLFERAIQCQAVRLSTVAPLTPEALAELAPEDIVQASGIRAGRLP